MKRLKKYLKLIVLMLICILVYLIYNTNNHYNITYISLGDGFAMGMNSDGLKGYGYQDYLKDYLKSHKKLHKYYSDFSYQDIRINDLYKDILINEKDGKEENLKQALRESNLLTLSIGLNDLVYQYSLVGDITESEAEEILSKIEKDLEKLIKEIKKYYQYEIYLIGYQNLFPQNSGEKKLLDQLNVKYKKLSTKLGIRYIDTSQIDNKNNNSIENSNNMYPYSEEYKKIFQKILEEITIQ
ncbi:MAG: hypothetical protein HFJ12_03655 [Bacilli bacterium]|nr:hypothetical protein [Bacilli bacterium]